MANASDFIGTVYNTLMKTLHIDNTSASEFMQIAWPGYALSAADFKPADAPNGPYDGDIAQETFSHIANIAPSFHRFKFENSGFEVDDLYEIVLAGAIPLGATPDTLASNPSYRLFSDAQYALLQARRGYKNDPNAFYYPCRATPINWYDEAAAAFWPTIEIKANQIEPIASGISAFVQAGGLTQVNQGMWKLKPESADEASLFHDMEAALRAKVEWLEQDLHANTGNTVIHTKPLSAGVSAATRATLGDVNAAAPLAALRARGLTTSVINPDFTRTPLFIDNFRSALAQSALSVKNIPVNRLASPNLQANLHNIDWAKRDLHGAATSKLDTAQKFLMKDLIDWLLPGKHVSAATDGFSVSFKFCRVNIDRPWLNLALLGTKNWTMLNTGLNEYSSGSADQNEGLFPLLPVSFIVIRDLKITANWSDDDRKTMAKSVSFGPFDLKEYSLEKNTLEVKGLQILAWISKLMPPLPPTQV